MEDEDHANFFNKVYLWMFVGLLVSGFCAYFVATSEALITFFVLTPYVFLITILVELGLVISLVGLVRRMSGRTAILLFLLYSLATGITLSVIFLVYTTSSIFYTFLITSLMFGAMSLYGYTTKKDLTSWGSILFMGLIGIIIASLINLFTQSSTADFIISFIAVIIFVGLTAYDTQKIKRHNVLGNAGSDEDTKEAILGALTLYLDLINMFLALLRLTGKRR